MNIELVSIDGIIPYIRNPRKKSDNSILKVAASLKEFGFRQPIVVDKEMVIVAGHTRYEAAKRLGMEKVPVHVAKNLTPTQIKAYRLADNRTAQEAIWDEELLPLELKDLELEGIDLALTGFDEEEIARFLADTDEDAIEGGEHASLSDRFLIPPFSVLNAREGWWQARKKAWIALGIQSELGRGESANNRAEPGSARINDAADGQRRYSSRKANAVPGGAPMPLDREKNIRRSAAKDSLIG